jgi:hypothetical protein
VAFGDYGNGWCSPTGNAKELHDRYIIGLENFINIAGRGHQYCLSCLSTTSNLDSTVSCLSFYQICLVPSVRRLLHITYLTISNSKSINDLGQLCRDASGLAVVLSLWKCLGYIDLYLPFFLHGQGTLCLPHQRRARNFCLLLYYIGQVAQLKRLLCDTTTGMSYSSQRIRKYPYKSLRLPAITFKMPVSNSPLLHACCDCSRAG